MEQYLIRIVRPSSTAPLRTYQIEVDGFLVGTLGSRSELNIPTSVGNHIIQFLWMGKVERMIQVYIPEGQYTTLISTKLNMWSGKLELEMANLSQGAVVNASTNMINQNVPFPIASQVTFKKKHQGKAVLLLIGCLAFWFMLILFFAILGSDSSETSEAVNSPDVQVVELTDEDKAQAELEKATAQFAEGKYREALEACNKIKEAYPNTETTSNMSRYISEQYAQYPHFTAKQLMAEYEANIVNADKEYTDQVMIVSGVISQIGKTNHDSNLCILLNSGTFFYSVQLNFDTSQTDALSALKEGNSIKAIGRCTGKSGKHFLIIDGENVMIEDCLLID